MARLVTLVLVAVAMAGCDAERFEMESAGASGAAWRLDKRTGEVCLFVPSPAQGAQPGTLMKFCAQ